MDLFKRIEKTFLIPPLLEKKGHFVVNDINGIALATAISYRKKKSKFLLVTNNLYNAQKLCNALAGFLQGETISLFPNDELVRAEGIAQSKEMVAQRLFVLDQILNNETNIVVTNVAGACRYLPDPDIFKNKIFNFKVGKCYDIQSIKIELVKNGYLLVNKVDQSLQFAVRGDILDIYSVNNDYPVRIEFFGDEVESIRFFDLATQTSIEKVEQITIMPASDMILSEEDIKRVPDRILQVLEKDQEIHDQGKFERLRDSTVEDISAIVEGQPNSKLYKYYSLVSTRHFSIFDYCQSFTKVLFDYDSIDTANKMFLEECFDYLFELQKEGKVISRLNLYQNINTLVDLKSDGVIHTTALVTNPNDSFLDVKAVPYKASKNSDAINIVQNYINDGYDIVISLNNHSHIDLLEEALSTLNIGFEKVLDFEMPKKTKIGIRIEALSSGFVLPSEKIVYLSGSDLFNERVRAGRFDNRFKEATILKSFEDLEPGDYVVHEYQGIGQFVELQTLEVEGTHKDYLKIAYSGNEFLYVPLTQFQLVRKYLGKEGATPRLSKLNSKDWENTKKKIKERVNDLAERLMNLYVERSKIKGFAFPKDDEFQERFENSFEHELTSDQQKAIKAIKEDMEKETPMDRLLCGDVGFGKTEVAFQAAFKAINAGKQVAILCPTTLLARQHYELAVKRFSEFDIKIAVFSRLIPEKKQKEYIEGLRNGSIHMAIGTHRLLSKEIVFNDIGLLIVDEEQRFGVEQKERLKELKTNLDVLTLSATPIPRTLQISLLGVRSLSKIDTPPQDRMPIQTYVTPYKLEIVKELIERELGRHGQVFYLHNNIESLYMVTSKLQRMLPDANISVAHGQMPRNEIEDVMMRFYQGDIDVLVCTSIIENGIDVPNANMIIVDDSDHYGLSQLYQIKGRVGRSNRIAYAYLMYNPNKILNEKAQKRLKAIQDFTELGSGYRIAQRDLMIRGAGDILGPEQAGFIDSIGLDMYIKLLNEAVQEKMNGHIDEDKPTYSSLNFDAFIPTEFANDSDKIELYQEILTAPNIEALSRIKVRTRDIYGKLPDEVNMLFVKRNIDLLSKEADIVKMEDKPRTVELILGSTYLNIRGVGNILFETLIPYLSKIKVTYANNVFKMSLLKNPTWVFDLENILKSLVNILENNKIQGEV